MSFIHSVPTNNKGKKTTPLFPGPFQVTKQVDLDVSPAPRLVLRLGPHTDVSDEGFSTLSSVFHRYSYPEE